MLHYSNYKGLKAVDLNATFEGRPVYRSGRLEKMRRRIFDAIPQVDSSRAKYVTESYIETEGEPVPIRRAKALRNVLQNMDIRILDDELIVGEIGPRDRCAQIYPDYSIDWLIDELNGRPFRLEDRPGDKYIIDPGDEKIIRSIAPFWRGKTHKDHVLSRMPREALDAYDVGMINTDYLITCAEGHITVNHTRVLQYGLESFKDRAIRAMESLDLTVPDNLNKLPFLQSVLINVDSIAMFAGRYARLASELASYETDEQRRKELLKIADVCSRVPLRPARDIHEAIQSIFLINLVLNIEGNASAFSFGRMDQKLYPYYLQAIEDGMTEDDIKELYSNLMLKMFQITRIMDWNSTSSFRGYIVAQNTTIGGQDHDGRDATNEMSYLILECQAIMQLNNPMSVRYHNRVSNRFMNAILDVNKLGGGQPAYYSDENYVLGLVNRGVPLKDALNYSCVGCGEPLIEGKQSTRPDGAAFVNIAKALEMALYGGTDPLTGRCLHKGTGDLSTFKSYNEVYAAFQEQMRYYIKMHVIYDNTLDYATETGIADPLVSMLVDDCIERGKTIKEGGAVYDFCAPLLMGIANTGNSLAAIKKTVFDDKAITGGELLHALKTNFEDMSTCPTGEDIRQLLLAAPKYGNDDDYVDNIMSEYFRFICEEESQYHTTRYGRGPIGGVWVPSTNTVSSNVPMGEKVGALPDGRKSGEPLADTTSPTHGTDTHGPTAALKSVSKLPNLLLSGGTLYNMRIDPKTVETPEARERFIALLRTYLGDFKGQHIQFNMIDSKILLDAKKNPEQYKDLMVRVAGYSALFTAIDEALQDDIIERTVHTV
ncbi:glycyl radical enzyme [Christensenellaceae bacterium]|nr:glycyl radical enzyme [Christensenellaceae bacterium]BDF60913.1 glycyl radical enzyme [Christensenellaceae bacterium]